MKYDFDVLVENSNGDKKVGDPVSKMVAEILEGFGGYEEGDKSAMWSLIGEIRRKSEVELNENEVELLRKYWANVNARLDIDMTVRSILDMEE